MLSIWSAGDASVLKDIFGRALKRFKPVPAHQFLPFKEGVAHAPSSGGVILVCGNRPLNELQRSGALPKNRTVTSMREKPVSAAGGGYYLVTFDPMSVASEPKNREIIDWDLRLAHRLLTTGTTEILAGDCKWVANFADLIDGINAEYESTGTPVDVAVDTETMGFYPWYPDKDIISISFTHRRGEAQALYLGELPGAVPVKDSGLVWEQVNWLMTSDRVRIRAANGKYDMIWIAEKWGIECTNFKFDSMLVGSVLDENRSNSLNLHAKLFTPYGGYDDAFNQTQDKGAMEAIPPDKLLPYAGGDTIAAQDASDVLREELLEDEELANFYITILHPAARAFEKLERRGMVIDKHKYQQLGDDLKKTISAEQSKALGLLPQTMRIKYKDRISEQIAAGKNPLLPSILKEFFFSKSGLNLKPYEFTPKLNKAGEKQPSMTKAHLRQFAHNPSAKAMVECLSEMDAASKTLSTFVDGFLKHVRPDGRIHPTYFLAHGAFDGYDDDDAGTVTGRLSAKDPAIQTLPKKTKWAKRLRECFPAPPGKKLLQVDYSQGELKVVACVANEKTMLKAYENGLDLHAVTGAQLAQVSLEEFLTWKNNPDKALAEAFDKNRSSAKPANFGLLYGMSAEGFQAYAWASYGLKLTLEEATVMRNAFFELYSGLPAYHERQRKLVKLHGMVRTPLGRIRHLPTINSWDRAVRSAAERQAINSPIQGCLTDMMIWSIALLEDAYKGDDLEVVAMIHDALIAYVPENADAQWAANVTGVMSNLPFDQVGWEPQLKFTADAEAGLDLAHMSGIKLAA